MTTPEARTVRQPTVFESITVPAVVTVEGPVYGVRFVPLGTPVFEESG